MSGPHKVIHRYEVVEQLGQGGMGELYLASDPLLDRLVAIKVLRTGFDSTELRERFAREARSAARLAHVNIVTIYDVGVHDGQPFLAMEYVPGETLLQKIRREAELSLATKLQYVEELCAGLAHAHRAGIIHRDVKPANLIVAPSGTLKILDFGLARLADSSSMTQSGTVMGTLNYMSPEQITGQPLDHRSDMFAVGAVFYELLSYQQAFPGRIDSGVFARITAGTPTPLDEICSGLDPALIEIVNRAMAKSPAARFDDLDSMRSALLQLRERLDGDVLGATLGTTGGRPTSAIEPPVEKTPRRGTDRAEIRRRRAAQLAAHLASARSAFIAARFEDAAAACERVLILEPDHEEAADLGERAREEIDRERLVEHTSDGAVEDEALVEPERPSVDETLVAPEPPAVDRVGAARVSQEQHDAELVAAEADHGETSPSPITAETDWRTPPLIPGRAGLPRFAIAAALVLTGMMAGVWAWTFGGDAEVGPVAQSPAVLPAVPPVRAPNPPADTPAPALVRPSQAATETGTPDRAAAATARQQADAPNPGKVSPSPGVTAAARTVSSGALGRPDTVPRDDRRDLSVPLAPAAPEPPPADAARPLEPVTPPEAAPFAAAAAVAPRDPPAAPPEAPSPTAAETSAAPARTSAPLAALSAPRPVKLTSLAGGPGKITFAQRGTSRSPAKPESCDIRIFQNAEPDRGYVEVGIINYHEERHRSRAGALSLEAVMPKLMATACQVGADAIFNIKVTDVKHLEFAMFNVRASVVRFAPD